MGIKLQECTISTTQNHNVSADLMWQLTAEYKCFLAWVYFCRNPEDNLNKILLKDLCNDSYAAYMSTDDVMQAHIGNWETIQNFMINVSLQSTATVYYKFLPVYTHFVRFHAKILLKYFKPG
jgi:hypothetical protein